MSSIDKSDAVEASTAIQADLDAVRMKEALGHNQQLVRGFGLFSLTSLGIIIAKYDAASTVEM